MKKKYRFSIPKKDDPSSYVDLAKIEYNLKDNSTYLFPKLYGDTGLHLSFHGSGTTHLRTTNPFFSSPIDRNMFLRDIKIKSRQLTKELYPYDNCPGDIFILRTKDLIDDIKKSSPVKGKRIILDLINMGKHISVVNNSKDIQKSIIRLKKQNLIHNTDLIVTGNENRMSIGTPISTIYFNPHSIEEYNRLPGITPMYDSFIKIPKEIKSLFPSEIPFITNLNKLCKKFDTEMNVM